MSPLNIDHIMHKAEIAAAKLQRLDQIQTDLIVKAVFEAGFNNRIHLARLAHKETRLGKWQDKVIKNFIATQVVYDDIKDLKTVEVISEDKEKGIVEIAQPIGPIFAITPITNPTSTVLFKILITLKSRNPIIIRPHGAAQKCSIETAQICYEAAREAGAPMDCIQWIKRSTKEETLALMAHKKTALVLATGSVELVRAAYRSGNPAIGVGPGNVPVFFGKTADIGFGVEQIVLSKTFDNGTVCASEQALVLQKYNAGRVIEEFRKHKAYFLSKKEIALVEKVSFNKANRVMNTEVIGQSAHTIAKMAGIDVPPDTSLLIAPLEEAGLSSPLSLEILAPILALYIVEDFKEAIEMCLQINQLGGLGHTVSIFSNNEAAIEHFTSKMNAGRVLVNTPASQGALGGTYNNLTPSFTLACGAGGKNITTDNISVMHLLNTKRIAERRVSDYVSKFSNHSNFEDASK